MPLKNLAQRVILSNFSGGMSAIVCMMEGSVRVHACAGRVSAVTGSFNFMSELQNTMRSLLKFACEQKQDCVRMRRNISEVV